MPSEIPALVDKVVADLEYRKQMEETLARNKAFVKPGADSYATSLSPDKEAAFRQWVAQNKVPFAPEQQLQDYDMRGFWSALQANDPRATSSVNPNDGKVHYPDFWKTPYHQSFSVESQWANPATAPVWNDKDQLVTPQGVVVFDERRRK